MTDVPRREFLKGAAVFGATCAFGAGMYVAGSPVSPVPPPSKPQPILRASTLLRGVDTAQFAIELPGSDKLVLAYNGKCKHLSCTVGWDARLGASADVPDYDGDGVNDGRVLCPCHQAQYDIYDLGTQVPGGPAPEPLDVIKIAWEDGVLMGLEQVHQTHQHEADGR